MKLSKYLIILAFLAVVSTACKKEGALKNDTQTDVFEEDVWADSVKTIQVLTSVYADLGPESMLTRINTSNSLSEFSDESDERWTATNVSPASAFQKGNYSPSSLPAPFNTIWANSYKSIRKACLFLANVDKSSLSPAMKKRMTAEARFLRAYYYHLLIKHYSGVPLIDKVLSIDENVDLPRNTFEECVNFITKDLDAAASNLPVDYIVIGQGQEYGRATKGACLALKARVLLHAASPLFNGGAAEPNPIFGYPTYDQNRWVKAAAAAKAVMDLGVYSLLEAANGNNSTAEGYYNVFLTRVNTEMILPRLAGSNRSLESSHLPTSRGGANHNNPNGDYVNTFPMKNGKPITDPSSGYDPQNPYVNRDPRFYRSVIYNGAIWASSSGDRPVYTYLNAPQDGLSLPFVGGTQSGYFNRKMMSEGLTGTTGGAQHFFPFLRYGEVLLNYAEALNESGQTAQAYAPMALIRQRAGLAPFELPSGLTQEEMRKYIRDERRIELSYEDHRFWDIRRWKIGASTYGKPLSGMKIVKTGATTYTYEEFDFTKPSVFIEPKMNLLPIPQTQINISTKLVQNPGW